ncbi:hypothetical protein SS50377_24670 [Spironucleus salmonicida]|uniref:Uncharacterized protein n=1 Tax=Spironucleus salmonicida TaxID=348837 RepID=A0A9P8LQW9_9EUKA|nr:hypothetical protein SS50377_24670 [Spironucleus salmonicida]
MNIEQIIKLHEEIIKALKQSTVDILTPILAQPLPISEYFLFVQLAAASPHLAIHTLAQQTGRDKTIFQDILYQLQGFVNKNYDNELTLSELSEQIKFKKSQMGPVPDIFKEQSENESKMSDIVKQLVRDHNFKTDQK